MAAGIPVYLLSLSGRIAVIVIACKAIEKLTREYFFSSATAVTVVVPDHRTSSTGAPPNSSWFPSSSSAVTADTVVASVDSAVVTAAAVSASDCASSTEKDVETLEFKVQTIGVEEEDNNNEEEERIIWSGRQNLESNFYSQTPDGANCGYNQSATKEKEKENQGQRPDSPESSQVIKEKEKEDHLSEKIMGQQECKYYLQSGGCKFGKAHKHSREKPVVPPAPPLDFNFLGLPIRLGERECTDYMRTGACKHGPNCRFHHPDPTAEGEGDIPSGSVSSHTSGALQSASTSWSSTPNETVPYLDADNPYVPRMLPPQGVHAYPEWNGYQSKAERECTNYMRAGFCKHGPNCRFHHLDPTAKGGDFPSGSVSLHTSGAFQSASTSWSSTPSETVPYLHVGNPYEPRMLPPHGVYTYPDWNGCQSKAERECMHYMRTGVCKHGPNCRFHHFDPTAKGGDFPSGSVSLHTSDAFQSASTSWSSTPNETVPYLHAGNPYEPRMLPPQEVHAYTEWNEYQAINFLNNEAEVLTSSAPMVWNNWNHLLENDATKASSRPNGTQPFFPANPSPLGWSKPKTRPAVNGTWTKGAKKTKTVRPGWCEICKIDCNSNDVLDRHKLGKKHKKKLEKLEESKKKASAPAATVAPAGKDPGIGPK